MTLLRKILSLAVTFSLLGALGAATAMPAQANPGNFITVWDTTKISSGSSPNNTIVLPLLTAGSYDFTVDYGDGSGQKRVTSATSADRIHNYATPGTYRVTITGKLVGWAFNRGGDRNKLINIERWGTFNPGPQVDGVFAGCENLTVSATDAPDLTGVTSLRSFFADAPGVNPFVGGWDLKDVQTIDEMFRGVRSFSGSGVESWNTSNVLSMAGTFRNTESFNGDVSGWNVGNVRSFRRTFSGAQAFNRDLSGWNVRGSGTSVQNMLDGASSMSNANIAALSNWYWAGRFVDSPTDFIARTYITQQTRSLYAARWPQTAYVNAIVVTPPAAPIVTATDISKSHVTIQWQIPQSTRPILGYVVSDGTRTFNVDSGASEFRVEKLEPGTEYTFEVSAISSLGSGPAGQVTATTIVTAPDAPQLTVSEVTATSALLSWTVPDDGGSPIIDYGLQVDTETPITIPAGENSYTLTGLMPSATYDVSLFARNKLGAGDPTQETLTTSAASTPGAPKLVVSLNGTSANLSWTPTDDGGAPIVQYVVTGPDGPIFLPGSTTSKTLTGLTCGQSATVYVQAVNAVGAGDAASSTFTPCQQTPEAPIVTAESSLSAISLSWLLGSDGGSPITEYILAIDGKETKLQPTATSYSFTGLEADRTYTVSVQAANAIGVGAAWVRQITAKPGTVPEAPAVDIEADATSLTLSWAPGADGGYPITGYEVSIDGVPTQLGASVRTYTFAGLVTGQSYELSVRAFNVLGGGPKWEANAIPHPTVSTPSEPEPLVNSSPNEITLLWNAPFDGNSPITSYTAKIDGVQAAVLPADASSYSFSGLVTGRTYRVELFASNAEGDGPAWGGDIVATAANLVPGTPSVTVAVSKNSITLDWVKPVDGSSPITGYDVSIDGSQVSVNDNTTTYSFGGLTEGKEYSLSVTAKNTFGAGPAWVGKATTKTQSQLPEAPAVIVQSSDDSITLLWNMPADNGTPITGYEVTIDGVIRTLPASTTSTTFSGLAKGQYYDLTVKAITASGDGVEWSGRIEATSGNATPSAPDVIVSATDTRITLNWNAPEDGSSPITGYEVVVDGAVLNIPASTTTHTLTQLAPGNTYQISLRAINIFGAGAEWTGSVKTQSLNQTPSAPVVGVQADSSSITLTWVEPDPGSAPILGYELTIDGALVVVPATTTSYTFTQLNAGQRYSFTVNATNIFGDGPSWIGSATPSGGSDVPDAPTSVNVSTTDHSITLVWKAPDSGNSPITSYTVRRSEPLSNGEEQAQVDTSAAEAADAAQRNADSIRGDAERAQSVADSAKADADAAQAIADEAKKDADESMFAQAYAEATQADADQARFLAGQAQAEADRIWGEFAAAQAIADEYRTAAANANTNDGPMSSSEVKLPADATTFTFSGLTNRSKYELTLLASNQAGDGAAWMAIVTVGENQPGPDPAPGPSPSGDIPPSIVYGLAIPVGASVCPPGWDGPSMETWSAPNPACHLIIEWDVAKGGYSVDPEKALSDAQEWLRLTYGGPVDVMSGTVRKIEITDVARVTFATGSAELNVFTKRRIAAAVKIAEASGADLFLGAARLKRESRATPLIDDLRVEKMVAYAVELGMPADRIQEVSYGETLNRVVFKRRVAAPGIIGLTGGA